MLIILMLPELFRTRFQSKIVVEIKMRNMCKLRQS